MRFSSTQRGARLARRFAAERLDAWGLPYGCELARNAELVVGELCANAVWHGCVAGRDFELRLAVVGRCVRIEVSDARDERYPPTAVRLPPPGAESGYGLVLVDALAVRWGSRPRDPVGKTVWAELARPVRPSGPLGR
ncbi:ATP-binding protein [Streptomyces sp. TRM 70351]|uniref:ATP-binding protein n=1 Tax=Streptomyces sp. TRM 70351 TaxID=3116552 RepID=UPI002E7ABFA4|nr:ATP-binding protein [Streptomyces sp. TRM 70351]MEE1928641.1 ATP-binding protein [Streptomyces sp. TRM 70351]